MYHVLHIPCWMGYVYPEVLLTICLCFLPGDPNLIEGPIKRKDCGLYLSPFSFVQPEHQQCCSSICTVLFQLLPLLFLGLVGESGSPLFVALFLRFRFMWI